MFDVPSREIRDKAKELSLAALRASRILLFKFHQKFKNSVRALHDNICRIKRAASTTKIPQIFFEKSKKAQNLASSAFSDLVDARAPLGFRLSPTVSSQVRW